MMKLQIEYLNNYISHVCVHIFCNILQEPSTFFEFATNIICFNLLKKLSVIFVDRIIFCCLLS